MSKAPKQSGTQTTTTKVELPQWLDQRYQQGAQLAQNLHSKGTPAPRMRGTPLSYWTKEGMDSMTDMSRAGVSDNAVDQWNDTLQGSYLHGGEGFDAAYDAASNRIIPQVTSAFNSAGRMNNTAGQSELTRQLGDSFAGLYDRERGRQMGALSMSPQMDTLAYEPARRQLQVGMLTDAQNKEMNAIGDQNRMALEQAPGDNLDRYLTRLGVISPRFQGSTSTQPVYSQGSSLGQIGGLALGAAGMMTGNPWLGLGGGLLGGGAHRGYTQGSGGYYQGFGY